MKRSLDGAARSAARLCVVSLVLLALSACASPKSRSTRFDVVRDTTGVPALYGPDHGRVLLSLTAENLNFQRAAVIAIPVLSNGGATRGQVVAALRADNGLPVPDEGPRSDFDDAQGRLISVTLPSGPYQLEPWLVYDNKRYLSLTKTTAWRFVVKNGETVYLGNYHFRLHPERDSRGRIDRMAQLGGVGFELRDRYEQDLRLMQAREPAFKPDSIRRADPKTLAWATAKRVAGRIEDASGASDAGDVALMVLGGLVRGGSFLPGGFGGFPRGGALSPLTVLCLLSALLWRRTRASSASPA